MSSPAPTRPDQPGRPGRSGRLERWTAWRHWPVSALVARVVLLLAPPAALGSSALAGDPPPLSVLAVTVLFSCGFAVAPESGAGLLALAAVLAWWSKVAGDGLHASVLVAAVLLTVAHVTGLVVSYGPSGARIDRAVAGVWAVRAALVLLAAPAVWLVARLVAGRPPEPALWQAGLAVAVAAVVVAAALLGVGRDEERAAGAR